MPNFTGIMRRTLTLVLLLSQVFTLRAQSDLFGPSESKAVRSGVLLNAFGSFDFPAADMAKRFDNSWRLGPGILYKTKTNWLFGAKFDFIVGRNVHEDSLMINIADKYGSQKQNLYEFINNSNQRIGVPVYQRGYATGLSAGKILSWSADHPDDGVVVLTTVGFMQHKINIYDKDKTVEQLREPYRKGYDRLTNGMFVEQYVGYVYFANNKLINFTLGVDILAGFTQGRRNFLYDVMRADDTRRLDILWGVRAGWFIPIYNRKSEDMMFE